MKQSESQMSPVNKQSLSVGKAVLIGHLIVNLPVLVIIAGVTTIGAGIALVAGYAFPSIVRYFWWIVLASTLAGSAVAWLWWSFMVPRWRKWALQQGTPPDQLQKWAAITGLVWPKGWIFEKTEFNTD